MKMERSEFHAGTDCKKIESRRRSNKGKFCRKNEKTTLEMMRQEWERGESNEDDNDKESSESVEWWS